MALHREKNKRYFIALIPPPPVYQELQALKEYFRDAYSSKAALRSPPHITLHMPFLWDEAKEHRLTSRLADFGRRQDPVKVCLDNFSCFAPRVIFVAVTESDALSRLQKELHSFCKRELDIFNANYRDKPFHPHLTLAFRDLKKDRFVPAWKEFENREFKAEFMADKIALLKHNGKNWEVLSQVLLQSSYSTELNPKLGTTEG